MKPYVTLERFKTMGFGVDLTDVEDFEVRAALTRATNRVGALTAWPVGHDFRGGTITDERHVYRVPRYVGEEWQRQVWLLHRPIISVEQFRVYVTDTQYLAFGAAELVVSPKFVDIVSLSLTTAGLFGTTALPFIGLRQPQVRVDYTYGETFASVDETFDPTDGRTFRGENQWWTTDTVTVKVDGTVIADTEYTVDRDEGTITFDTNQAEGVLVEVSYTYRLPTEIAQAAGILASMELGDRETRARGMQGLSRIRVGDIELQKGSASKDGDPQLQAVMELLDGFRPPMWAGSGAAW